MERLTKSERNYCGRYDLDCKSCEDRYCGCDQDCENSALEALGSIEDILGPTYDLSRLKELVEADREGRYKVFAFKPGDKLHKIWKVNGQNRIAEFVITKVSSAMPGIWMVSFTKPGSGLHRACNVEEIGKTVFLTREEAEAALKKLEED